MSLNIQPVSAASPVSSYPSGEAAGAATPTSETPPSSAEGAVPAAGLKKLKDADPSYDPNSSPLVNMISEGDPAGVTGTPEQFKTIPETAVLVANPKAVLTKTGLGLYKMQDGQVAMFNPKVISLAEVKEMDARGKLSLLLTPLTELFKSPQKAPGGLYGGMGAPGPKAGASAATAPADPRAVNARMRASTGKPVSSRPSPLGGSLYNDIVSQAV